jgi:hypothetical protein
MPAKSLVAGGSPTREGALALCPSGFPEKFPERSSNPHKCLSSVLVTNRMSLAQSIRPLIPLVIGLAVGGVGATLFQEMENF